MCSEYLVSPLCQLDESFIISKNFYSFNDYDNEKDQREINNNTTLFGNFDSRYYFDNSEKKNEEKENSSIKLDFNRYHEEDNFNEIGFKTPFDKMQSKNLLEKKLINLGNSKTKATSFIGKKTKKSDDSDFTNFNNSEKIENNGNNKRGRKKKNSVFKGNHNKHTEDNIMRKIKTNFFKYINEQLNQKLKNKNYKFLKLDSKINEYLKKDYNINLMKKKIKDLYLDSKISLKYRTKKNNDINIRIIEDIYKKMEEIDVINTLELTYLDLFEEFRKNYLGQLLVHIREDEERKNESENDINEYLEKFYNLCLNYEEWFKNKKGRNRNKNNE